MRKIVRFLLPVLVLAGSAAVIQLQFASRPEPEKKDDTIRPLSLFVEEVQRETTHLQVRTQGEVAPKTEIDLVAQVSGRIVSVADNFVSGATVFPGKTLVQIEDTDYQLDYIRAEARVAGARVQVQQREASADIARRQWADWIEDGKPSPLALKEPQVEEARAQLKAAEADLKSAELSLNRTRVSVPFAGRVRMKIADLGQFVTVGTPLGKVFSTAVAEIRLPLSDDQLSSLGLPIGFEAGAGGGPPVTFSAIVGGALRTWHGSLVRVDSSVDPRSRLIYGVAEVQEPYGAGADNGMPMPVGLFVEAEIQGKMLENAMAIPRAALRGNTRVYVVNKDDELEIRQVSVIHYDRERVYIAGDIAPGDLVVTSPMKSAIEGTKVEPLRKTATLKIATKQTGSET